MRTLVRLCFAAVAVIVVLAGCGGSNGSNGADGSNGMDGQSNLVSIVSEPAGTNCAHGGFKVTSGTDTNGNGTLDSGEATSTEYACNGTNGTNGSDGNSAPIANAGTDQKVAEAGLMVTLNGSGSSDPDDNSLSYAWTISARPAGSIAMPSSAVSSNPTFTPDKAGRYELSLMVNDGQVDSPADTVTVRAGMPLPDTGQTRWYSTVFGDDGDYIVNPMSYADNGDGTILDNVTGLTWQKCSMGQSGLDCETGTAAAYNWYQASGTYDATSNPSAVNTCGSLNLAGTGWRLPTRLELMTIVDFGRYAPSINIAYFPATASSYYWSNTNSASSATIAWTVYFGYSYPSTFIKTSSRYVRCVR